MKNRIVMARELAGLTQKELAARLEISPSTLNGYEKGNHDPKSPGLAAIAKVCGVTVDYLLGLSDQPGGHLVVQVQDTDPQMDELLRFAEQLNAQGKERLCRYAEDLMGNPAYRKREN